MTVLDYLKEVSGRAGKALSQNLENGENAKTVLLRAFNLYHKDFNNRFLWPWRWRTLTLQTTPNYEDGTVSVAKGSRVVSGVSTSWSSGMAGRFLKLDRDTEIYEILSVENGGALTLVKPYLGESGSTLTYIIWRKFYDLDPEVPYSTILNVSEIPHESAPMSRRDLDASFVEAYRERNPEAWALADISRKISTYNTGTVSLLKDSRTLTGSGTAFLDNASIGSEVVLGGDIYNVDLVDSDTQITLVQKGVTAVNSSSYEIRTRNRTRIILSSVPNPAVNLYVTYPRKQYSLFNDNDETPVWEGFEHIVADCMYGYFLEKLTSDDSYNWLKIYRDETREAWRSIQEMNPLDRIIHPQGDGIPSGYRRSIYG